MKTMDWICVFRLLHFLYTAAVAVALMFVAASVWNAGTTPGFIASIVVGLVSGVFAQTAAAILREGYTTKNTNPNLEQQKEK